MNHSHWIAALCVASVCHAGLGAQGRGEVPAQQPAKTAPAVEEGDRVNASAAAQQDFKRRIDEYVALQKKLSSNAQPLKETNDPAQILAAEQALESRIVTARSGAKWGDIFTPEIRKEFRKLLAPPMTANAKADAKAVVNDDAPPSIPLKVNARYPDGAPFPTVPTTLLKQLPTLPEELEFRIIDGHLILRDTKANIIVDFIPNATTIK